MGDWVYLKLHLYKQASAALRKNLKLCPRFFSPYKVVQKAGTIAYKLLLPEEILTHHVFHVSLLKKKVGD